MAAAIHDAAAGFHTEAATIRTNNYAVTSGATLLVVAVFVDTTSDLNPVASSDLDGSLTAVSGGEVIAAAANQGLAVFFKQNPTVGTHSLTGDWDAGSNIGGFMAVTFDGTNATTPIADAGTDGGSDEQYSTTVANVVSTDLVIDFFAVNGQPTISMGANQTQQINTNTGSAGGTTYGMSTQSGADGGVMSGTWGSQGNQRTAHVAFRLPEAAAGGGVRRKGSLALLGVGR